MDAQPCPSAFYYMDVAVFFYMLMIMAIFFSKIQITCC